jgi:hypothetical protein
LGRGDSLIGNGSTVEGSYNRTSIAPLAKKHENVLLPITLRKCFVKWNKKLSKQFWAKGWGKSIF